MEKFDYEKAKAGHPLCTRGGREVKILTFEAKNRYPIFGMIKDSIQDEMARWDEKGRWDSEYSSADDLMMAPKKVVKWENIYKYENTGRYMSVFYDSEEDAKKHTSDNDYGEWHFVATIKSNWEEEI